MFSSKLKNNTINLKNKRIVKKAKKKKKLKKNQKHFPPRYRKSVYSSSELSEDASSSEDSS